jgi:hypothetical protein
VTELRLSHGVRLYTTQVSAARVSSGWAVTGAGNEKETAETAEKYNFLEKAFLVEDPVVLINKALLGGLGGRKPLILSLGKAGRSATSLPAEDPGRKRRAQHEHEG